MAHTTDIQDLLDRYWDGETTLEEERRLKAFFAAGNVPEELRNEARFFMALQQEKALEMPANPAVVAMPNRRMGWFGWAAAASVALLLGAGTWWWMRQPDPVQQPFVRNTPVVAPTAPTPAVAATPVQENPGPETPKAAKRPQRHSAPALANPAPESIEDPEQALAEIKAALALVSSKLNKGRKGADKGLHEIGTLDKIVKTGQDG